MTNNYLRHLGSLFNQDKDTTLNDPVRFAANNAKITFGDKAFVKVTKIEIPPEFNAKDWLTFLLHVDAELEHSLMVQYLYSAYSMGVTR